MRVSTTFEFATWDEYRAFLRGVDRIAELYDGPSVEEATRRIEVAAAAASPALTRDAVKVAVEAFTKERGTPGAVEVRKILEEFGVRRVSDLKDDQLAAFVGRLT